MKQFVLLFFICFSLKAYSQIDSLQKKKDQGEIWANSRKKAFKFTANDSLFIKNNSDAPFGYNIYNRAQDLGGLEFVFFNSNIGEVVGPVFLGNSAYLFKVVRYDSIYMAHLQHLLLLPTGKSKKDTLATIKMAEKYLSEIKAGKNFAKLISQVSKDTATANKEGDIGWFWVGATGVKELDEFLRPAKENDMKVIRSGDGVHIMRVVGPKIKNRFRVVMLPLVKKL